MTKIRLLMTLFASALVLAGCALSPRQAVPAPIVFVHGNGDSASIWQTTIWRFESNGWAADRLHAIDLPYPLARDDDAVAQPGRTGTGDHMAFLRSEVEAVVARTGASQVILIGNSRGGNAIRNYIQNGGGEARVSHAILAGVPNHGIWSIKGVREGNEFSGLSPFIQRLNAPKPPDGNEVVPPVRWLTIRSDTNDKYAQPDGRWIERPGTPTNIGYDGPALRGATNIVLPRVDHRETGFSPAAFDVMFRFLTGRPPRAGALGVSDTVVLDGKISGLGLRSEDPASGDFANNLAVAGARIEVFETDAATGERRGPAVHRRTVAADGRWGPFDARPGTTYEFVIAADGYPVNHVYRSAFSRSSAVIHFRLLRAPATDKDAGAVVAMTRPRGYFDAERDRMSLGGMTPPPGVPPTGAGIATSRLRLDAVEPRTVTGEFNGERIAARSWSPARDHVVVIEMTY
ncbi:MAG: alpha/beta fold hydrolase [Burkholderiaceae bacterium]